MASTHHEKQRNRAANAGGVPRDAYHTSITLAVAMNELRPKKRGNTPIASPDFGRFHLYFFYLWITGQLALLTDAKDIPTLELVSASADCQAHRLRRIRANGRSWVEYAQAYPCAHGVHYLWQPMPTALNPLFRDYLTQSSCLTLTLRQKQQLFRQLKIRKWRAPRSLRHRHMIRKDRLFDYVTNEARIDPFLSTPAKVMLIGRAHHRNACAYQSLSSDQIRYETFTALNRYLDRLAIAINDQQLRPYCELIMPTKRACPILSQSVSRPDYLMQSGSICAYQLKVTKATRTYVAIAPTRFGSHRALNVADLRAFFQALDTHITSLKPTNNHDIAALIEYHNAQALELSLLFVLLTGVRPTHHISIERRRCFDLRFALVRDKGRYRSIELCAYLKTKIEQHTLTQRVLIQTLNLTEKITYSLLWFHIDEQRSAHPHTAKQLRQFMSQHWQACFECTPSVSAPSYAVPYQLRHSFAQHALLSTAPRLATQHVDTLMGHSKFGEHVSDHYHFSTTNALLTEHLNQWPKYLGLRATRQANKECA